MVPEGAEAVEKWLQGLASRLSPQIVSFINAHAVNLTMKDTLFSDALLTSDHLLRDGSGMKMMLKLLGRPPGENLNGTDLIPRIIDAFVDKFGEMDRKPRVAIIGTQSPWVDEAAIAIQKKGCEVKLVMDGFQSEDAYMRALSTPPVDLIVLGMGMPRQEKLAVSLKTSLKYPVTILNGGAILDFLGGKVERAPLIVRKAGMEWLWRLGKEPKRLFGRYVVGNAVFIFRALCLKLGAKPQDVD